MYGSRRFDHRKLASVSAALSAAAEFGSGRWNRQSSRLRKLKLCTTYASHAVPAPYLHRLLHKPFPERHHACIVLSFVAYYVRKIAGA